MKAAYLACGGWVASTVGVAASLGLADHVKDAPLSADELAARTGTTAPALAGVLAVLVETGLFILEDGRYRTTEEGARLREDHPESVKYFCQLASGDYQRIFQHLAHTVATGEPAARPALGATLYEHLEADAQAAEVYDRAMEDLTRASSRVLATTRDFRGVRTIVDVGGGRGGLLKGVLRALDGVSGIVVDRPDVCARAQAALPQTAPDLAGRLTFAGGDFFTSVPAGADRYLVKNVLHNWGDADAVRLLRVIAKATAGARDARVLIIEAVEDGRMPPMYRALDGLMQRVVSAPGAMPRTVAALEDLARAAGFAVTDTGWLPSGHVVIEMHAAPGGL
ncbi:MAG: methyltransferase [Vicinamibacterales bacterium]|nr:methyltransferase [Vicinamibacterales bacterium]